MPGDEVGAVSPSLKKSISEHDSCLATYVAAWLRKRGKALRPRLNEEQKAQLEECFELMDADGSGAIDADELGAAFKLLGIQANKTEITELLAEVDSDGSGEVEYPEFIQIMTSTLAKLSERKEQEGTANNQVPFALLATAYRRKRIMEGLTSGDKELTAQVIQIAEEAARKAADEAAHHAQERRARSLSSHSSIGAHSTCSTASSSHSAHSSTGAEDRGVQVAAAAGASPSLLRAITKVRSLKISEGGGRRSGNGSRLGSHSGNGSTPALLAELLEEPEAAKHITDMLRQHAINKKSDGQRAAGTILHQRSLGSHSVAAGGSSGTAAASHETSTLFSQHRTSQLQQKLLTQQLEVPKFMLSARSPSTTPKQQCSRSSSRVRRLSSTSPLPPSHSLQGPLGSDPSLSWQPAAASCAQQQRQEQQPQQEGVAPFAGFNSSSNNGDYRARSLVGRRSKSFNSLDSVCLFQQASGMSPTASLGSGLGHWNALGGLSSPCSASSSAHSNSRASPISPHRASPTSGGRLPAGVLGKQQQQQQPRSYSVDRSGIAAAKYAAFGSR